MRLNFSGSGEDKIREGVRRIGRVVSEQVELYETITHQALPGSSSSPDPGAAQPGRDDDQTESAGADVVPMKRPRKRER